MQERVVGKGHGQSFKKESPELAFQGRSRLFVASNGVSVDAQAEEMEYPEVRRRLLNSSDRPDSFCNSALLPERVLLSVGRHLNVPQGILCQGLEQVFNACVKTCKGTPRRSRNRTRTSGVF